MVLQINFSVYTQVDNLTNESSMIALLTSCSFGVEPWIASDDFLPENSFILYLLLCIYIFLTSLAAVVANSILVAAILMTPSLSSPSCLLIASQAVSDLVMGLYLQLHFLFLLQGLIQQLLNACKILDVIKPISWAISWVSLLNSVFLSIDRYLAIYLGMNYRGVVSISRVRYAIILLWLSSAFPTMCSYLLIQTPSQNAYAGLILANICISGISFCYLKALKLLRNRFTSVNGTNSTGSASSQSSAESSSQTSSARMDLAKYSRSVWTLVVVEVVFVVLSVPVMCSWVYFIVKGAGPQSSAIVTATSLQWHCVAFVNPGIHIYRMKDVRHACREVLRKVKSIIVCS